MTIQHKQALLWIEHLLIMICIDKATCQLMELTHRSRIFADVCANQWCLVLQTKRIDML